MRDRNKEFKVLLQARVREQNLIHELVVINQVLAEASEQLGKRVKQIPLLKEQIKKLQMELNQSRLNGDLSPEKQAPLDNQPRIEKARREAEIQRKNDKILIPHKISTASIGETVFISKEKRQEREGAISFFKRKI